MEYVLIAGAAVVVVVAISKRMGDGPAAVDQRRAFTPQQRNQIFARAGHRCEHFGLFGRCRATPTQADHIYPWSKGGETSLANGAALCAKHNRAKSNHVPSSWYVHRLERRRHRYFPPGERVDVIRTRM